MPREPTIDYDKTTLIEDLKQAGFDDCLAQDIGNRVDAVKGKNWTHDMGRQEAIRQARILLNNSHMALDAFRAASLPEHKRFLAETIGEGSPA